MRERVCETTRILLTWTLYDGKKLRKSPRKVTVKSKQGTGPSAVQLHFQPLPLGGATGLAWVRASLRPQGFASPPCFSSSVSSVAQPCLTLCDPVDCSTPGFPVHHQLMELAQTHDHHVGDAIQPSHPLSSPSPFVFNLFQHQGLFKWVGSSHQVTKVLELQLQHQSFQWIFRTDFL